MSENNANGSKDPKETVKLEVYKGLIQYGCQMSQDHLNYDRILMPISLVPAYLVLTSLDVREAGLPAELIILFGGFLLLVFWIMRNIRSRARLYETWDKVSCLEEGFEVPGIGKVLDTIAPHWAPKDFTLKIVFFVLAVLLYLAVLIYVIVRACKC